MNAPVNPPVLHRHPVGNGELCVFEWGRPGPQPSILLAHATGFHARCWDRVVAEMPDRHVLALDLPGHGRSRGPGPWHWERMANDVTALVERLDLPPLVAAGHSMGGHCLLAAAIAAPGRFARLVLLDPVILPPEIYAARPRRDGPVDPSEHPTSKRRNHFRDWAEMFERFRDRHPYSRWRLEVLEDYCRHGVRPADPAAGEGGEGVVLCCAPEVEASIYLGSSARDPYADLDRATMPVVVLRGLPRDWSRQDGAMDFSTSPTWPGLAAALPDGRDVPLPHLSHFIPMEEPELAARWILGTAD